MKDLTLLELFQDITHVDPYFRYWERADERGIEVKYPDEGWAQPSYMREDGTFRFARDEAQVVWYCVKRLEGMGYGRNVHTRYENETLSYGIELIQLRTGKIAYEPVYYPSELHAICRAYFSMLVYHDGLEATNS